MKLWTSGYTEDPSDNFLSFQGRTKDGDQTATEDFYVKGFKASYIETEGDQLTLGLNNHAFIH